MKRILLIEDAVQVHGNYIICSAEEGAWDGWQLDVPTGIEITHARDAQEMISILPLMSGFDMIITDINIPLNLSCPTCCLGGRSIYDETACKHAKAFGEWLSRMLPKVSLPAIPYLSNKKPIHSRGRWTSLDLSLEEKWLRWTGSDRRVIGCRCPQPYGVIAAAAARQLSKKLIVNTSDVNHAGEGLWALVQLGLVGREDVVQAQEQERKVVAFSMRHTYFSVNSENSFRTGEKFVKENWIRLFDDIR